MNLAKELLDIASAAAYAQAQDTSTELHRVVKEAEANAAKGELCMVLPGAQCSGSTVEQLIALGFTVVDMPDDQRHISWFPTGWQPKI